ncbi:MAG: hypothetical protein LIO90_02490 [Bacteroidales bacterium]|nr:hypothetical protein [Bacteroidales bacterium]
MKRHHSFITTTMLAALLTAAAPMTSTTAARELKPLIGDYYGTNYTVPFAHAYRALGYLGVDRKEAIDRDVYHMSRLGLNAFRLHLWDVELADHEGNLQSNDHLDLLDYLIAQLEQRQISIILTAQTNFGNGYPERNSDPNGAYSYRYDKCAIHADDEAIAAQSRYIQALAQHVNPYTSLSYATDPMILAMEINNEPCHTAEAPQVTAYINTMAEALRSAGWDKTVLYNVSHNPQVAEAYYEADIDGTTYQWYPLNLVSGHTRHGNFLPFVDQYEIPFKEMKGYEALSRVVYEYDPADNLYSYVFPAAARTFRKEGFQWITQFAYDPIDLAWANTEYQTHYLNLAYTPGKALGMMVAAEVTRQTPLGANYGSYPADTIFGPFMVSARRDLAMVNDGQKYYYTNTTDVAPASFDTMEQIAGHGSSPVIAYEGSGAYFLDRIEQGVWRLEVMPDVMLTADPFAKPSLKRRVGEIVYRQHPLKATLPGLDAQLVALRIDNGEIATAQDATFEVTPGVYLLGVSAGALKALDLTAAYGDGTKRINEYVAPQPSDALLALAHHPVVTAQIGRPLTLDVEVASTLRMDSLQLYPSTVSFWNHHNPIYTLEDRGQGHYSLTLESPALLAWAGAEEGRYNLVAWCEGRPFTYPEGREGAPLDWDYDESSAQYYHTAIYDPSRPLRLLTPQADLDGSEISTLPSRWEGTRYGYEHGGRPADDQLTASMWDVKEPTNIVVLKHVGDMLQDVTIPDTHHLNVETGACEGIDDLQLALITRDGLSYNAHLPLVPGVHSLTIDDFALSTTLLCPEPYPVFLGREFTPDSSAATIPLHLSEIEDIQVIGHAEAGSNASLALKSVWIER